MRFVVYGAGGIGGVLGARLFEHGHEVVLIARGAHGEAIRERGLVVESPDTTVTLRIDTVATPDEVAWKDGDVVLLTMKSQDTAARSTRWSISSTATPVVCVQNGVANERTALRLFANVYGVCVMCPTSYLEPGVVQANSTPTTGIMDIGRYPFGVDEVAVDIAAAFSESTYVSEARPDIMRSKYQKLLMNLGNSIEATCGPSARGGELAARAKAEGVAVLDGRGNRLRHRRGGRRPSRRPPAHASDRRSAPWRGLDLAELRSRAPAPSRPTSSTARSCCSAGSTACRRR